MLEEAGVAPLPRMRSWKLMKVELKFKFKLKFLGIQVCQRAALSLANLPTQVLFPFSHSGSFKKRNSTEF